MAHASIDATGTWKCELPHTLEEGEGGALTSGEINTRPSAYHSGAIEPSLEHRSHV
jgi:hypothetical protein